MIPIDEVTKESESTPLRRLEDLLRDGTLARAHEAKVLGSTLAAASHTLVEARLEATLEALLPAARMASDALASRKDAETGLAEIRMVARALREATTRAEVQLLPEKIRHARVRRETLQRDLQVAWARFLENSFHGPSRLGELLCRFSGTRSEGERVRQLSTGALAIKAIFPPTIEQVEQVEKVIGDLKLELEVLRAREETKDLLAFLDRVLAGTATLEDVSPKLIEWLRQHNALGLLKIQL